MRLTRVEAVPFEGDFFPVTIRSAVCYFLELTIDAYVGVMIANQTY
jgi:hypothetical protein